MNDAQMTSDVEHIGLLDLLIPLAERWKLLVFGALGAGLAALAATYLIAPTYTARTVFLPPQEPRSVAASALASIGALAGVGIGGATSPADQYVTLMTSANVGDRIVDRFNLMEVYGKDQRSEVLKALADNVNISIGKKDGLITVEVSDTDPQRAADIANAEVEELRRLTKELALTKAQQRRAFFEDQLKSTRDRLVEAQRALQSTGFGSGALNAEPKAAAERYAQVQAQVTATEVRLQTLRRSLTDSAPEVRQQLAQLIALQSQLQRLESSTKMSSGPDYVGKFREFKYQETLFDLLSRQYELARLDESREGALIQVIDVAIAPEHKSRPKRALTAVAVTFSSFMVLALFALVQHGWRNARTDARSSAKIARLLAALPFSSR